MPVGRKAHVAPSLSALPKRVMAAATLAKMVVGARMRSGGEGGGEGEGGGDGSGEGGGEGGGGEGRGGKGGGDGGGGSAGGGGASQVETEP